MRYDNISRGLAHELKLRFTQEYPLVENNDSTHHRDFHQLWEGLQRSNRCCGVNGPLDFNVSWWHDHIYATLDPTDKETSSFTPPENLLLPWSCCSPAAAEHELAPAPGLRPRALANTVRGRLLAKSKEDDELEDAAAEDDDQEGSSATAATKHKQPPRQRYKQILRMIEEGPLLSPGVWCRYSPNAGAKWHYHAGCADPVRHYFDRCADALFVIGLCVIGFLKFTFLGLLRFEIKEMIQKIKVLQSENHQMNGEVALGTEAASAEAVSAGSLGCGGGGGGGGCGGSGGGGGIGSSPPPTSNLTSIIVMNRQPHLPSEPTMAVVTSSESIRLNNLCSAPSESKRNLLAPSAQSTPAHLAQNHVVSLNPGDEDEQEDLAEEERASKPTSLGRELHQALAKAMKGSSIQTAI